MTTGTGWCFGGPKVTDEEANALLVRRQWSVSSGGTLTNLLDRAQTQALMAFGPDGRKADLLDRIAPDGAVNWTAPAGEWTVYALSQRPSGTKVERAAPGGEGWMINLAHAPAMSNFLRWMDAAFANYQGAMPRAQYHDSYEYHMDWSPSLLAEFERRRGYRLQDHLDAFLTGQPADRAARVKCDYRETISDIMAEVTLPMWSRWARDRGFLTRNQAHGSPGNWLDLYAVADIPETEMFHRDRNRLISKFASSAAHVTGRRLVSAETGTWLREHFTETLADMKYLVDDLFLSGVNHVFYHGACYSPDEVPWPGWVFYASTQMNSRNPIWRDTDALNAYITRCQSVLQAGQPDNDILLYWPIHDLWSRPDGMTLNLNIHRRAWFEEQPIGKLAQKLWNAGYQFNYVSGRQLAAAKVENGKITTPGGVYRIVVVPQTRVISAETLRALDRLAETGATVVFQGETPEDVAGLGDLDAKRQSLQFLARSGIGNPVEPGANRRSRHGKGELVVWKHGELSSLTGVPRETLFDIPGLMCIRRKLDDGRYYFIANRGEQTVDGWVPLATAARSVVILDPLSGRAGMAAIRRSAANQTEVRLQLPPGASVILRILDTRAVEGPAFPLWEPAGESRTLGGNWQVRFLAGGPELPAAFATRRLASWTELGDTNQTQRFGGTAAYTLAFDAPGGQPPPRAATWQLDLGRVFQSARVTVNGRSHGTLITPPFRVVVDNLKPAGNVLEIEVTSTAANRIRDLDRRGVQWQNFHDINFVNIDYRPFNAADWPLADAGLLGPVTLTPVQLREP
ncbi:MAG TPA: glycosyl hydrolase [Candidatus Omnitrophota bacterium]|nr:glycosyl hydrolase [Candidatus Omnitrophota bacterium]